MEALALDFLSTIIASSSTRNMSRVYEDLSAMRTRELKRYLLKLGAEHNDIQKLLDKKEMIALAFGLLSDDETSKAHASKLKLAYYVTICIGILLIMFVVKDFVLALLSGLMSFFASEMYMVKTKLRTLRMAIRHGKFVGVISLLLSLCCDCLVNAIQISILASWVIPRHSYLRRYLIFAFSLPMSPQQMLGFGSSTFSLDVGPMITLWVLRWLSAKFGEVLGAQLIDVVDKKNERKMHRAAKRSNAPQDSYAFSNTFFKPGSVFLDRRGDDDLEELKGRFFGRSKQTDDDFGIDESGCDDESLNSSSGSIRFKVNIPEARSYTEHLPDFLREVSSGDTSILKERNDGSEEIFQDALDDGSTVLCNRCNGLVKASRFAAHDAYWCSALDCGPGGDHSSEQEDDNTIED